VKQLRLDDRRLRRERGPGLALLHPLTVTRAWGAPPLKRVLNAWIPRALAVLRAREPSGPHRQRALVPGSRYDFWYESSGYAKSFVLFTRRKGIGVLR
jgi:hypothetical protein